MEENRGTEEQRLEFEKVGTILRWRMARRVCGGSSVEERTERRGELLRWKEATKKGERGVRVDELKIISGWQPKLGKGKKD